MRPYPLYEHPEITNFGQLISLRANTAPNNVAFQYMNKKHIVTVTYFQFKQDIKKLGGFFKNQGLNNNKIAVLGENSYLWLLTYFSAVLSSNIIVPIDKELETNEIGDLLIQCNAVALVCSNTYIDIAEKLREHGVVRAIFNMDDFQSLLSCESNYELSLDETDENAVCSIIFTSGTTGKPKGVMLTQRNLMLDAINSIRNVGITGASMLTLPLHHTFAFTTSILGEFACGLPIPISSSLRTFNIDMQTFKPQNICLVPLYVETMYKNIWKTAKAQKKDGLLKLLIGISNFTRRFGLDLRRKLFRSILLQFGGNLDLLICGGAPIDQKYVDGLTDIGLQVLNGYGITECSPVVAVNRNKFSKKNSVGLPLHGCEIKIVDGEICVKGDIVMVGYYHDETSTQEVMKDGWFRTGDLGYLDSDGFLFITGRKKNLIILSNGENVCPEELEEKLLRIDGIEEVIVSVEDELITAEIYAEDQTGIQHNIGILNKELPTYKRIQKVKFRSSEFEKTTTRKIKRI